MKLQTTAIVNGKHVFKLAWERAKKLKAIPNWSKQPKNRRKILKIYIEAQIKNLNTKTKYEVDHIIPLYHEKVCGLHVFENLQVLSKEQNHLKSNEFTPYKEIKGRKYLLERTNGSTKGSKIPKKHNRTKKNPLKIAKKRSKTVKNRKKSVRKSHSFFKVK